MDKFEQDLEAIREAIRRARQTLKSQRAGPDDNEMLARESLERAADEIADLDFEYDLVVDPLKPGETRSRSRSRSSSRN